MPKTLKLSEQAVKDAIEECPESKCLLESLFPEMKTDATVRLVSDYIDQGQAPRAMVWCTQPVWA